MNFKICNILNLNIKFGSYSDFLGIFSLPNVKTVTCLNQYYFNISFKQNEYVNNLMKFDFIHPDGIGIFLAGKFLCPKIFNVEVINGSDFYPMILNYAEEFNKKIFLFGDRKEILSRAKNNILDKFPNLKVVGSLDGYRDLSEKKIVDIINRDQPEILFVGLGAPRQEKWITENINNLNVKKIIAVGGWFRILANDRKRGPKIFRKIGLEWLVRLLTEPKYVWKRYLFGIPLFILRIIILKIKKSGFK
jgi:N-acetylglucosaminyldiphosphoundecaprenol N-acetyl-beta-D-mannosaminyltransferase